MNLPSAPRRKRTSDSLLAIDEVAMVGYEGSMIGESRTTRPRSWCCGCERSCFVTWKFQSWVTARVPTDVTPFASGATMCQLLIPEMQ